MSDSNQTETAQDPDCDVDVRITHESEQSPTQEIADTVANQGTNLQLAMRAGATQDQVRMMRDYRNRVRDSHKASMKLLGFDVPDDDEDEDMSITVTGDNHYHMAPPPAMPQPQPQQPAPQPAPQPQIIETAKQKLWPLVTAAALATLGSGLGGVGLAALLLDREPKPAPTEPTGADTDTQYELRISSGD